MSLDRRTALKTLAAAGAAVAGTPRSAAAREPRRPPEDAVGLLYDATLCVGCKSCMTACYDANFDGRPPGDLHYDADRLSSTCKSVVKEYREGAEQSFVRAQCMHCVDPPCISACIMGAIDKREHGIVTWEGDKCIGCRYCQVACQFGAPTFEWDEALPEIVKCELCKDRIAEGLEPACAETCPTGAVAYGTRTDLLAEAHRRIEAAPERYEPKVYGETDCGGTQCLYLSRAGISFTDLGLPDLGDRSVAHTPESVQHTIYKGFIAPVVLYGLLGAVIWRNRRAGELGGEEADQ